VRFEAVEALLMVRQTMVKESLQAGVRPAASVYAEGALKAGVYVVVVVVVVVEIGTWVLCVEAVSMDVDGPGK
jgi:hypothetical protein